MENNTPHTQLPENLIVVDNDWLEIGFESVNTIVSNYEDNKLLKDSEYYKYKGMQIIFNTVKSNSFPLTPILMDAFIDGNLVRKDIDVNKALAEYILLPITLKKK